MTRDHLDVEIRPFRIDIPQAYSRRPGRQAGAYPLANELPPEERRGGVQTGPVPPGWEYGVPLDYVKNLVEYWQTRYDWREWEEAELLPAVHHHHRRAEYPLPARPLPRVRRHATDPHPRLA